MTKRTGITGGTLRAKRSDTLVGSIEKQYKIKLNVRSDMELGTFLKKEGFHSLSELIRNKK